MERFSFFITAIFGILFVTGSVHAEDFSPKPELVPLVKAYVPVGFDSNDQVVIAVEGEFPKNCYRVSDATKKIEAPPEENGTGKIFISQTALKYGGNCSGWPVTFNQTVRVGIVPKGNYEFFDALTKRPLGKIEVKAATKLDADDYDYANVIEAHVDLDGKGGGTVVLTVALPDACTAVKKTLVNYSSDVLVVQPIVETKGKCPKRRQIKVVEEPIIGRLPAKFLLHVRSASGGSVNNLLEFSMDEVRDGDDL